MQTYTYIFTIIIISHAFSGEEIMCLLRLLLIVFIIGMFNISFADSSYDWQTGNMYNTTQDSMGNTDVNGMNTHTGSTWNTTIEQNGDMHGVDSDHNYWNYNNATGYYHNFGTGETCIGKGYARSCE